MLNVNKIDIVVYFSEVIYQFLLVCFRVRTSQIPDETDKFC